MNITFNHKQILNVVGEAVAASNAEEVKAIVKRVFNEYSFHEVNPEDLLKIAVDIVNKRHTLNIKVRY